MCWHPSSLNSRPQFVSSIIQQKLAEFGDAGSGSVVSGSLEAPVLMTLVIE